MKHDIIDGKSYVNIGSQVLQINLILFESLVPSRALSFV
jgi:hypothetical protein